MRNLSPNSAVNAVRRYPDGWNAFAYVGDPNTQIDPLGTETWSGSHTYDEDFEALKDAISSSIGATAKANAKQALDTLIANLPETKLQQLAEAFDIDWESVTVTRPLLQNFALDQVETAAKSAALNHIGWSTKTFGVEGSSSATVNEDDTRDMTSPRPNITYASGNIDLEGNGGADVASTVGVNLTGNLQIVMSPNDHLWNPGATTPPTGLAAGGSTGVKFIPQYSLTIGFKVKLEALAEVTGGLSVNVGKQGAEYREFEIKEN